MMGFLTRFPDRMVLDGYIIIDCGDHETTTMLRSLLGVGEEVFVSQGLSAPGPYRPLQTIEIEHGTGNVPLLSHES